MKANPFVSVCMPTYNSEHLVAGALKSILSQSYQNFEIIISDDCSRDKTLQIIKALKSPKIRIYKNKINLGYGKNMQTFKKQVKGEIMFLMAQDDYLVNDGLRRTVEAFLQHSDVGVVTRPYYWFAKDPQVAIRHIPPIAIGKDVVVDIRKQPEKIIPIIESVGQLSGLAYRTDLFTQFHEEIFPAHIYPFMEILKNYICVYLGIYTIAAGVLDSQTRSKSSIYDISPTASWLKMFDTVFAGDQFKRVKEIAKDHMAQNYLGLIQLKNYARSPRILYREIWLMIKYRWRNIFSPSFWFFSLGTIIVPSFILIPLVDWYKNRVSVYQLKQIKFS